MAIPERTTCRISGEPLVPLFTLGNLFISDFIPPDEPSPGDEKKVELKMMLAPQSGLVQLAHTAPSDDMYRRYWYRSGTNKSMVKELKAIAEKATELMRPKAGDVWVDIGCNDGTLLSFVPTDVTRVGFDPANNTFMEAESRKHANEIVVDYFTNENFKKTETGAAGKKAKVVTSIAMFYDLEDPNSFVQDVKNVMDDEGLWIIQMSYLPLMLEQLAFDNICHEHLEYYSLEALKYLLDKNGMVIVDSEMNDVNGGSFRIYIRKANANVQKFASAPYRDVANMRVAQMLEYEKKLDLKNPKTYQTFFERIQKLRDETVAFIKAEKAKGKKIWGYGASTKGNTLLQWYGIDKSMLDGISDALDIKYKHRTVGTEIPIYSDEDMRKAKPDYLLVLPWHFIYGFTVREAEYLKNGGKFIVPCPRFEIIGA